MPSTSEDDCTVPCHLTMGIHYEKCVIRLFCHCGNIIGCSYTKRDGLAYHTPRLYGIPALYMQLILD